MGKLQDCIGLVKASHDLNDEDVADILAAVDEGQSANEAIDTVAGELEAYRNGVIAQVEEGAPEMAEPEKPKEPKKREITDAQKKKGQSRIYNASFRELAAHPNVQQFAVANAGDLQTFVEASEEYLENFLAERKEDARKNNDRIELAVLSELLTTDGKAPVSVFGSDYYKTLQGKATRAHQKAEKERKLAEFKDTARAALRAKKWEGISLGNVRSFVRGWHQALNKKPVSNMKDQSAYANAGFREAKALMGEYNITAGKQEKFIGSGGRLRRMHEMLEKEKSGTKTDKQFIDSIYRIADRSSILSHDIIHPLAPGGVHRLLDEIKNRTQTFKKWRGHKDGGGTYRYMDSYSEATLRHLAQGDFARKEIEEDAKAYVDTLAKMAAVFENNKDGNLENLMGDLAEVYGDRKEGDDTFVVPAYNELDNYLEWLPRALKNLIKGNPDMETFYIKSLFDNQNNPYIPPKRTKPLIRKKLESITRVGFPLHRNGKNVTAKMMQEDLGFKEVFAGINGNVQEHMNYGYDALHDLAQLADLDPKQIGLMDLWFGVGALGQGGRTAAHFSPAWPIPDNEGDIPEGYNAGDTVPHIHLTATSGDGTVAHEWTHALDWALSRTERGRELVQSIYEALKSPYKSRSQIDRTMREIYNYGYIYGTDIAPEAMEKFPGTTAADKKARAAYTYLLKLADEERDYRFERNNPPRGSSNFFQEALLLDEGASKTYWSTSKELLARAGESYYYDTIQDLEKSSDYLVSSWVADGTLNKDNGYKGKPYATGDERKELNNIFESFIASIDWTGETPVPKADWTPSVGLADKQTFDLEVSDLLKQFDTFEAEKRKEYEEEEAKMKAAEEAALADKREEEVSELEDLVDDEVLDIIEEQVEQESEPLIEDMDPGEIENLLDEMEADIEETAQEDHDKVEQSDGESIGELLGEVGEHGTEALKEALAGLSDLFGTNGKLNSFPPGFDPESYAKAKPHFAAALHELIQAGFSAKKAILKLKELFPAAIKYLAYYLNVDYRQSQLHKRSFAQYLYEQFKAGSAPTNNAQLKRMLSLQKGKPVDQIDQFEMKAAQEAIEVAIVKVARDIVQGKGTVDQKYNSLVDLYQKQPLLNITTTTSADQQAYSTPVPLAFLASLAAEANTGRVYEPTAGNGALLINTTPENAVVNELNEERANNLRGQGFTVDGRDALDFVETGWNMSPVDSVIMNPPFGALHEEGRANAQLRTGYKIDKIDQAIVAESLRALKDDGKASIIIGANKEAGEISNQDRTFFNWLYSHYNVKDHFEIDGKLYNRQGAGWPIRFITIEGRKDEDNSVSPTAGEIERLGDWGAIYERTTGNKLTEGMAPVVGGPAAVAGDGGAGTAPAGGAPDELGTAQEPTAGETGDVGGAGTGTGAGEPAGAGGGGTGRADTGRDGGTGGRPTGDSAGLGAGGPRAEGGPGTGGTDTGSGVSRGSKRAGKRLDEFQSKYTSFSESPADDTLRVPANLSQAITDSLNKVQSEIGSFDDFLLDRLKYKSKEDLHSALAAHQIDAVVMAIYQIERGKALIIGDQTGVGKGRQAAAIIRYAKLQGKTPIFFTAKKALYTDMHRDLQGIDEPHNPWVTNNSYGVSSTDKRGKSVTLFSQTDKKQAKNMDHILKTGTLPPGMDMVFSSYSQIQNVASDKRRRALLALAPNSILILDESHESAGQSERGNYMTNMLELSSGATYLSGTYSKRPDTMPIYFKTDMFDAVDSNDDLVQAMTAGGEPLQQAVSHMLAKSGQLITRQRTFEGIKMETKVIGEPMPGDDTISDAEQLEADNQVASSNEVTSVLRMVHDADSSFATVAVPQLESQQNQMGAGMTAAGNKASKITVSHSPFTSTIFNVTRQMLLAIKVNSIADQAITAHQRGEKPIIALSSTIEAMHTEFVQQHGIKAGQDISMLTYKDVLRRSLRNVRRVKYTDRKGMREWYDTVPVEQLPPQTQALFLAAEAKINGMSDQVIDGMPASPIDWITYRLEKEGITVGELTGRSNKIIYDGKGGAIYEKKSKEEKDAVATAKRFNDKQAQALILNISGSTGISLHAAQEFGDHNTRHMIIAQPELDINIYVQILGRINRFRQLKKPIYTSVTTSIPAELRLLSMLYAKLKKLNANVSSDTKSNTQIEAPDILNKYGDQIIQEWVDENAEMVQHYDRLLGGIAGDPGAASKMTGRIGMLPVMDQRAFYDSVVPAYEAYIEELTARGENDLITEMLDYDAIETDSEVIIEGKDPTSEFGQDTVWGMYSIKRQGNPPTAAEVASRLLKSQKRADGTTMTGDEYIKQYVSDLRTSLDPEIEAAKARIETIEKEVQPILDQNLPKDDPKLLAIKDKQHEAVMLTGAIARVNKSEKTLESNLLALGFGKPISFTDNDGVRMQGVVVEIKSKLAKPSISANPMAPSRISVIVMVNNGKRELPFTLSKFHSENNPSVIWGGKMKELFAEQDLDARERQQIITGNLIAGLTEENVAKKGRIINYTTHDGTEEIGIKLNPSFDRGSMLSGNYPMRKPEDIVDFILNNKDDRNLIATGVRSGVGVLVYPDPQGIKIWVPGAANMKKSWWGNPQLTEYTGDFVDASGTGSAKRKTAVVSNRDDMVGAVRVLMKKAAFFVTKSTAKQAKEFVDSRADQEPDLESRYGPVEGAITRAEAQEILDGLDLAPDIKDRIEITTNDDPNNAARGRYSPSKGTVQIFHDRISSPEEALKTIRHEVIGHWGFRELMGPQVYAQLKKRVNLAINTDAAIKAVADQVRKLYPDINEDAFADEVIARISEQEVNTSMASRIWNYIRMWLRNVGLAGSVSMSEIHDLVRRSQENIQRETGARMAAKPVPAMLQRQSGLPESAYREDAPLPGWIDGPKDAFLESRYDDDQQRAMAAKVGNIYDERSIPQKIKDAWNNDIRPRMWKRIEQATMDRYASIRDVDLHSWKLARMSHTASGVVEHLFKHGRVLVNEEGGISSRSDETLGKGMAEILAPLGEDVDRFFNWMIANRAEELAAEGRENWLSDEDIAAGKTMNQGETEEGVARDELYETVRDEFMALQNHVVDIAQELGVINNEERDTWNEEFYIPFYRVLDGDSEARGPKMLDGLTSQTAYKRLKGAERQIGDPMSNVLQNWQQLMSSGMKNRAAQEVVKKGLEIGIMEEVSSFNPPKGAFFIRGEGEVTELGSSGEEETRTVQGMKKWYISNDNVVLDAISALNLSDINFPGMKTISFAKRIFTAGVTMNPEFMIANLIRDSIHSAAVTPTGKNPFMNVIKGINLTKKGSRVERQMLAGGGALHFGLMYADDPAGAKLLIRKHIEEDTIINSEQDLMGAITGIKNTWMEVGSRVENINRTALYDKLINEGVSDFEANFQARDLLDFSQGGSFVLVRFLTQAVPFLNARLQGMHKLGRSINDPQQRAQFIAVLGAYLGAAMALYLMYKDDDDFKKREEWDRDSYHWFKIGDVAYRIPRPFEIGVAATVSERLWEAAMEEEGTPELFAERMLHALGQTFEFDPVPQLFRPVLNVAVDEDPFTKRRIEGESLRGLPPEERRRLWTSETAIAMSKGMSNVLWKEATLSPIQIEYMIKGYTGWVGATALSIFDMAASGAMNEPSRPAGRYPADLPLVGRFARDLPEPHTKYMSRFYEQNAEIKEIYNLYKELLKRGDKPGAKRVIKEHKEELKYKKSYGKVERALAKVNREILRIRMSNMDRDAKKKRIDQLTERKNKLAEKIVKKRGY